MTSVSGHLVYVSHMFKYQLVKQMFDSKKHVCLDCTPCEAVDEVLMLMHFVGVSAKAVSKGGRIVMECHHWRSYCHGVSSQEV